MHIEAGPKGNLSTKITGDLDFIHRILLNRVNDIQAHFNQSWQKPFHIAARVQPRLHPQGVRLVDDFDVVGPEECIKNLGSKESPGLRAEVVRPIDCIGVELMVGALNQPKVEIGINAIKSVNRIRVGIVVHQRVGHPP